MTAEVSLIKAFINKPSEAFSYAIALFLIGGGTTMYSMGEEKDKMATKVYVQEHVKDAIAPVMKQMQQDKVDTDCDRTRSDLIVLGDMQFRYSQAYKTDKNIYLEKQIKKIKDDISDKKDFLKGCQ